MTMAYLTGREVWEIVGIGLVIRFIGDWFGWWDEPPDDTPDE